MSEVLGKRAKPCQLGRRGAEEVKGRQLEGEQQMVDRVEMLQMNRKVSIGGATGQRRGGKKRCQRPGNPVTY